MMLKDKVEFSILMHVLEEGEIERGGETYPAVMRYDVSEITACQTGVSYNTGVEELRAEPIAKDNPRLKDLERRFTALRIRQIEARRV